MAVFRAIMIFRWTSPPTSPSHSGSDMYYSSASSPKDKAMMLRRHNQRKAGELKALAEERERLIEGIKEMQEEQRVADDKELQQRWAAGEVSTYSAVGMTEQDLLALCRGEQGRMARKHLLPKAFAVADRAMDHEDPRVALVGAKLAFDAAAPTKEELEELGKVGRVQTRVIERRVIDA